MMPPKTDYDSIPVTPQEEKEWARVDAERAEILKTMGERDPIPNGFKVIGYMFPKKSLKGDLSRIEKSFAVLQKKRGWVFVPHEDFSKRPQSIDTAKELCKIKE